MEGSERIARRGRISIRYVAMGVVILAAWNFFAPFLNAPSWAPYLEVLPVVVGQTETRTAFVNATHIAVLFVAAVVVMKT